MLPNMYIIYQEAFLFIKRKDFIMKKIILVEKKQYIEVLDEDENCCSKNCENFTKVVFNC